MTLPHVLDEGTDVHTSDGEKVGELRRIVIDRESFVVTHVVVDIGFLRADPHQVLRQGLGGEYDRVVPIESVEPDTTDRLRLRLTRDAFMAMPEYTDEHYERPHDLSPGLHEAGDTRRLEQQVWKFYPGADQPIWIVEKLHKAVDERDIEEGTPVWRREPHEKIGEVDKILVNTTTGRAEAFVIRRGFLFKKEVVLPWRYVTEVLDDLIHVEMNDEQVKELPEYEG